MAGKHGFHYAREKLGFAVYLLATGRGDVRSRLLPAFQEFGPLREEELPEDLRDDYRWVRSQLTKFDPVGREGRVAATLERIRNSTGQRIAEKIYQINSRLEELS